MAQWYSTFTIILKIFTRPSLFAALFPRLCASSTACSQRACFARDMTTLAASSWKYANLRAGAVDCGVLTKKLHSLDSLVKHHGINLVANGCNMWGFKMILVSTLVWIPRWCLCSRSLLSKSLQFFQGFCLCSSGVHIWKILRSTNQPSTMASIPNLQNPQRINKHWTPMSTK